MEIIFNNQIKEIPGQCQLQQFIDQMMGEEQRGIAVAVNQTVIPKGDWRQYMLKSKDDVFVIRATQGG